MNVLSLSLINKDGPAIRGMADGHEERWAVFDFINLVCGKTQGDNYAHVCFARLVKSESEHKDEVLSFCQVYKFPGRRQRDTPTMTIRGLQRLLMILGGKVASEYRALVETTFTRVLAGDRSLIKIIESNASSNAPINEACRAALANDPSPGGILKDTALDELTLKYKDEEMALDIRKRKLDLDNADIDTERKRFDLDNDKERARIELTTFTYASFKTSLEAMNPSGGLDSKTRVDLSNMIMNDLRDSRSNNSQKRLGNGEPTVPIPATLSISQVLREQGLNKEASNPKDLASIGRLVAHKYREDHDGHEPLKSTRIVNGMDLPVNAYTESDRDIIESSIKEYKSTLEKANKQRKITFVHI